jgi:[glutamine synthetase] adenylyltransferase / [glutamine synthetase]-adenylyl-L-tyrosine phosphorylase
MVETQRLREYLGRQSRFLATHVDRHPFWLKDLAASGDLNRGFSERDFAREMERMPATQPAALRYASFRRRQLLRILLRDVLCLTTLSETTEELSSLAGVILNTALDEILNALAERHGRPDSDLCVLALGKLGGQELNYSSDIDLLFVYGENGETEGPVPISYKEFFKKAGAQLTSLLSTYTPEGFCYRVDLRLRPEGKHGEVCISLDGARHYYEHRARDWELQMMIKARPAAGNMAIGAALLEFIEPLTYATTLDFSAIETMSETRARLNEKLNAKRPGTDIKLTRGGIRDIEFLVQCLQRLHGGRSPWVRHGGTLLALARLQDKGLISESEYSRLANAYSFLRHLEHRLQFLDDRQTHVLPASYDELAALAERMPPQPGFEPSAEGLRRTLDHHLEGVVDIYDRVVHAQQTRPARGEEKTALVASPHQSNVLHALATKAPHFAARSLTAMQRRRLKSFEHFLEYVEAQPALLSNIEANETLQKSIVELFEASPFFAEHLARNPALVLDVQPDAPALDPPQEASSLRSYFRRAAMRIQAGSIVRSTPVFDTLGQMSDLADGVIAKAYELAVASFGVPDGKGMMIIALGRLGMREFDLDSDADLVFVLPDESAPHLLAWTRIAERVIEILASYTSAGAIFSVDTRLRPSGREGGLVQTCGAFLEYFEKRAEAWEGIAYMKARAVAGNLERATEFLGRLQETDWRHWGQSGRSRGDLLEMRMRLEKEQGKGNPLKAGMGGYYDIDFLLLYLRLRSAGVFFKVLNTPERIDVLEKMGHLERSDAHFLGEAAALYRALDHGLRLYSGHAEGKLPAAEVKIEALAGLVSRWLPAEEVPVSLPDKLALVKQRTREVFLRFFAI